jgi:signal transduction histidine kinase
VNPNRFRFPRVRRLKDRTGARGLPGRFNPLTMIRNSITAKLLLAFFAVLIVSFSVTSAVTFWLVGSELRDRHRKIEDEQLNVMLALVRSAFRERWSEEMLASAIKVALGPQDRTVYVLDRQGQVIFRTGTEETPPALTAAEFRRVLLGQVYRKREGPAGSGASEWLAAPVNGPPGSPARAVMIRSSGAFQRDVSMFRGVLRDAMLVSMFASAAIVLFVARPITSRLRRMNAAAGTIAKGRFDIRLNEEPRDEIGQLAATLNRMSAELGSLDRMRREWVANVSHDLRSPLTSIGGYVEALLDGAVPREKEKHYLGLIREHTRRMNRLVNDLLDLARIEAGQDEINPVPYNLTEWVRRLLARFEPEFARRNLRFALGGDEEDVWVRADPDAIDRVLTNLVQNAMQFSPPGGMVDVSVVRRGDRAIVAVTDQGPGIPDEELSRIWTRFYKSDKARTAHSGIGLGLSIVRHILERHGTVPQVESDPGAGTRFSFTLPVVVPAPVQPPIPVNGAPSGDF